MRRSSRQQWLHLLHGARRPDPHPQQLRKRRERFDAVLIETTGLADPGPVAQTFFIDEELKSTTRSMPL